MWFLLTAAWKPWWAYWERLRGVGKGPKPPALLRSPSYCQSNGHQSPASALVGNGGWVTSRRKRRFSVMDRTPIAGSRGSGWPKSSFPVSVSDLHEGQLHRAPWHSITGVEYLRTEPGSQATGHPGVQQSHSASVPQPQATMRATTHRLCHTPLLSGRTLNHEAVQHRRKQARTLAAWMG